MCPETKYRAALHQIRPKQASRMWHLVMHRDRPHNAKKQSYQPLLYLITVATGDTSAGNASLHDSFVGGDV